MCAHVSHTLMPKKKNLRVDVKARAPDKQPICGLWATARCVGVHLKTAKDVEDFRQKCRPVLKAHSANWVGGTDEEERQAICELHGYSVQSIMKKPGITVGKLFRSNKFFTTRHQWLLCVDRHCVYVKTNKTKRKMWVSDQRGKPMRFRNAQKVSDTALEPLLRQQVVSLCVVEKRV